MRSKEERQKLGETYRQEKEKRKKEEEAFKAMQKREKLALKAPHKAKEGYYLSCVGLNKVYSRGVHAVIDFNLDVKKGEFIVLVGPSGCGKSTTLRMIAGLEDISSGELFIDGKYVNRLEPKQRGVAMVFQSYALYPHLSVFENLAFGLRGSKIVAPQTQLDPEEKKRIEAEYEGKLAEAKEAYRMATKQEKPALLAKVKLLKRQKHVDLEKARRPVLNESGQPIVAERKIRSGEIAERILSASKALQIEEYLDRKPTQLSGGQCQRVALGRAMVRNAKIFLLDEPLSNLDAKLRVQMRSELVQLHENLGTTMLYVTHDQTEAMTMADRIVVMKDGLVQQIGTPMEVYQTPSNVFVATFIGSPNMNLLQGTVKGSSLFLGEREYPLDESEKESILSFYNGKLGQIAVSLQEVEKEEDKNLLLQEKSRLEKALSDGVYPVYFGIRPEDILLEEEEEECYPEMEITCQVSELLGAEYYLHFSFLGQEMVAKVPNKRPIAHGEKVKVGFKKNAIHLFDLDTEDRIF